MKVKIKSKSDEKGAALIALLAIMAIIALTMLAAAPSVYQQVQREREAETIRRGREVSEAIKIFVDYNNRLPKSMDELLEGVNQKGRTKKLMILRPSAAKDPLSSKGEWRLVQSNEKTLVNFQRKVIVYNNGQTPPVLTNQIWRTVYTQITSTVADTSEDTDPPGGEDDSSNSDVPFVGVVSRAQTKSVLTFYGIERHDWWVFTPIYSGVQQQPIPLATPTPTN